MGMTIDMAAGNFQIAYGSEFNDTITAIGLTKRAVIYGYGGNDRFSRLRPVLTGSVLRYSAALGLLTKMC